MKQNWDAQKDNQQWRDPQVCVIMSSQAKLGLPQGAQVCVA